MMSKRKRARARAEDADPNRPRKTCVNPFELFMREFRSVHPNSFGSLVAEAWRGLPEEAKEKLNRQCRVEREKHAKAIEEYEKAPAYQEYQVVRQMRKEARKGTIRLHEREGYFLFIRKMFRKSHMEHTAEENAWTFARMWMELSEEEREEYR